MIKSQISKYMKQQPQLLILLFLITILSITTPKFATAANFLNILKQVSVIAIISSGLTMVAIGGCLDLSVGSALSLLNVISVTMQLRNDSLAVILPIVVAVFIGLFNGLIVTAFDANSIIVTLGSLSFFAGLALFYTNGAIIIGKSGSWYALIAQGKVVGFPIHVLIFIAIAVIYEFVLKKTSFGRSLFYIGTNLEAARIVGIRTKLIRTITFLVSSMSVGIAAIILGSRMISGTPVAGVGFEFDAITAIVIGGTSLFGGKGGIRNTIVGVLLLAVIINALTLYNIPFAFQNISKGLLIIIAVIADVKSRGRLEK
jgi:ribose/xylose/arabinose/galactoside ABC-type transport system permease subunit